MPAVRCTVGMMEYLCPPHEVNLAWLDVLVKQHLDIVSVNVLFLCHFPANLCLLRESRLVFTIIMPIKLKGNKVNENYP
jgi:hypothetical protein